MLWKRANEKLSQWMVGRPRLWALLSGLVLAITYVVVSLLVQSHRTSPTRSTRDIAIAGCLILVLGSLATFVVRSWKSRRRRR